MYFNGAFSSIMKRNEYMYLGSLLMTFKSIMDFTKKIPH